MLKKLVERTQERNRKISLPAAVFNRSPLKASKISQNSSVIGNISCSTVLSDRSCIDQRPVCSNHPNKTGKFYILSEDDDEHIDYCEKCAILLASQGFKVNRYESCKKNQINDKKEEVLILKPNREQDLKRFLLTSNEKINKLQNNLKHYEQSLQETNQKYQKNIQRIRQFFKFILEILHKHQNKCEHIAKQAKHSIQNTSKNNSKYLQQQIDIIKSMKQDVQTSYTSILNDTSQQDYQKVMTHYIKTLSDIQTKDPLDYREQPYLPQVETIQSLLADYIGKNIHSNNFSFDTSQQSFT